MNHLALLSILADNLHIWVPIPVFNSFSLKMSLTHFVHDTIDFQNGEKKNPNMCAIDIFAHICDYCHRNAS